MNIDANYEQNTNTPIYDDITYPLAIDRNGFRYDPPNWESCYNCEILEERANEEAWPGDWKAHIHCPICNDIGYTPIYYTPQEWKEAGGILTDDTPVWIYFDEPEIPSWELDEYQYVKDIIENKATVYIATSTGRPEKRKE